MSASAGKIAGVAISNPDKVWWPDDGITKADIARFYVGLWSRLLPWLRDRPLTAERCPDGMLGSCFYQKDFPEDRAPAGPRLVLQATSTGKDVRYIVGGSRGGYIIRPETLELAGFEINYIEYLFLMMLSLAVIALATARTIERSQLGFGFATIRDDELAAEASGVPTLRVKLVATTLSGAFMGMAGAPFPYYIGYLQPQSAFGLEYAVNSIAMPMIGGTTSWIGPLIGAILLGSLQQIAIVTISSAVSLLMQVFREVPTVSTSLLCLAVIVGLTLWLAGRAVEEREYVLEQ